MPDSKGQSDSISWRDRFAHWMTRNIATPYNGVTVCDLHDLLRRNHYRVDPPYWLRALGLAGVAPLNSLRAVIERWRFGGKIEQAKIDPPLFVLGHWRSGTTHLHNLLSMDDRFAYPTTFQAVYPRTFLSGERFHQWFMGWFVPSSRPMDNMALGIGMPQEDEFALMVLTRLSIFTGLVFPNREAEYERYLTLDGVPAEELARWKHSMMWFLRKLSFRYGKPLILKSPPHTGRIRLLLELFPDARFVHVSRNPFDVFRSTRHMIAKVGQTCALKRRAMDQLDEGVLRRYQLMHDAYFDQRSLIPRNRLCELRYEDLDADPVQQIRRVYEKLSLPEFSVVEPKLRAYVTSLAGYQKNPPQQLEPALAASIVESCEQSFQEWGYARTQ